MKISLSALVLLLASFLCSYGQDSIQLKRSPYLLTVAIDKKTVYEENLKATPFVLPNRAVQLYPGETVFIEIEQENGIIKSVTAVNKNINPLKTLTISFTQNAKNKIHQLMMLKVDNPFEKDLIYTTKIFLFQYHKWVDSDVYPVVAGLSGYETWPDVITSIALGKWAFKSK